MIDQLFAFTQVDPLQAYADLLVYARRVFNQRVAHAALSRQRVERLHIGSGKDYQAGWFNVDILPRSVPDAILDLSLPQQWPLELDSPIQGPVRLEAGTLQRVYANNVLEHVHEPAHLDDQLSGPAAGIGHLRHRSALRESPQRLAGPHARARLQHQILDLLHRLVLVPGLLEYRFKVTRFTFLDGQLRRARSPRRTSCASPWKRWPPAWPSA